MFPSRVQKNASFSRWILECILLIERPVNFSLTRNSGKVSAEVKGFELRKETSKITLFCVSLRGMPTRQREAIRTAQRGYCFSQCRGHCSRSFRWVRLMRIVSGVSSSGAHSNQPWSKPWISLCVGEDGSWTSGAGQWGSLLVKQCVCVCGSCCKGR